MKYKVGMYGGCFDPLHIGHVNDIIIGSNMCEKLYVVLSNSNYVHSDEFSEKISPFLIFFSFSHFRQSFFFHLSSVSTYQTLQGLD